MGMFKKAEARLSVIISVLSGRIHATDGAKELGLSRKNYYEWENRGLQAMREALEDRPPGRPSTPVDPEKEQLLNENARLRMELEIAKKTIEVKTALADFERQQKSLLNDSSVMPGKKKPGKKTR